jgi:ABC-type sulfate transport system substrate-binding protein
MCWATVSQVGEAFRYIYLLGMLAADSNYGGDSVQKKTYVKPKIRTEVFEPRALGDALSGSSTK